MSEFTIWHCAACGHIVISKEKPDPIHWTDGHTCQDWIPENEIKGEKNV